MNYGLNDEQYNAIVTPSPVYLNASAGAGKTKTLIAKINYLLDFGAPVGSIMAITFTNKAANEMRERLKGICDVKKMQISTIHSMCVRIIRKFIGYTYLKYPFSIYDDGDQMSVIKTLIKARDLPGDPYEYLNYISRKKSGGNVLENKEFEMVFLEYQEILKQNNAADFDDLQVLAYECLQHDDCRSYYNNLWKHILVDEFQDTSAIQFKIIDKLYNPLITKTLFAVGDKNQSIYSWRCARPENIDDFIKKYHANVKQLTYNYRSCSEVINHANLFLQYGSSMVPKIATRGQVSVTVFPSYEDEAEQIATALLQMGNYNGTAIIYRVNTRSIYFEKAFTKHRIPYRLVNELAFFQRRVSKDLLAALSAANNPEDRTNLARIINNPKRGFGDIKKAQLLKEGRGYLNTVVDDLPLVREFIKLLDEIKGMRPFLALEMYLNRSGYRNTIEKDSDRYMVEALMEVVKDYNSVEDLILASSFLEQNSKNGVNLITAHGSKGLEFDRVFVVGAEEGLWPHKNALDIAEERRLYYVSISRAKRYLNVSYSKYKIFKGCNILNNPSELFLKSYREVKGVDFYG